jgi:pentafunctional AROM polypeptide
VDLVVGRYASQILGSHHVVGSTVTLEKAVTLLQQCALQGPAHGAKLVLSIKPDKQDRMAYEAALSALISTSLASQTRLTSHCLDSWQDWTIQSHFEFFLCATVTQELLTTPAALGQLTANEILATRLLTKMLRPKRLGT